MHNRVQYLHSMDFILYKVWYVAVDQMTLSSKEVCSFVCVLESGIT